MRQGASGMAIAAGVLGVLTLLFAGLFFHANSQVNKYLDELQGLTAEQISDTYQNGRVRTTLQTAATAQANFESEQSVTRDLQQQVNNVRGDLATAQTRIDSLENQLKVKDGQIDAAQKTRNDLQNQIRTVQNATNAAKDQRINEVNRWYQDALADSKKNQELAAGIKEQYEELVRKSRAQILQLRTELASLQQQSLTWGATARGATSSDDNDGLVLEVDLENRFVVVNIGRLQGARRGMRFGVQRWRYNRWDPIGEVELIEVKETTSNALIVEYQDEKKVCPVTGWVAPNPEMMYSPWVTFTGSDEIERPVLLRSFGAESRLSMNPYDPIIKNDAIYNPFFSPNRKLKFYIVGDPFIYSLGEIKIQIERSSGVLVDELTADVDHVIVCNIPTADDVRNDREASRRRDAMLRAENTAKAQGIPFIREVDLLRFLED